MINNITIGDLSIDCADPARTRDFYAAFTGWEKRKAYGCPAVISDGGLLILFMGCEFEYAPPVWPEEPRKQQKQMHFNFQVDDVPSAVAEAIKLGAIKTAAQYGGEHYVTMLDPEGHPFCLCAK
jgi:catechol 2,3-dioxygenase-like lactoylglutathione lyase family enzyme